MIGSASASRYRDSGTTYEGQVGIALDHRIIDWLSLRGGYRHALALDGSSFRENRGLMEQTIHLTVPARLGLDLRTREDLRWLDTGFSARFRERVTLHRDIDLVGYRLTPYFSAEVFFDTRYDQLNRYRLTVGASLPVKAPLSLEPYLTRQTDFIPSLQNTNALGLTAVLTF